jgi:hypothetical protein
VDVYTVLKVMRNDGVQEERLERCAVVGNSGTLRETHYGAAIDAAQFVMRFNSGRSKGFESHVGRGSDVRLYNGPYVTSKMAGEMTLAQVLPPPLLV